MGGIEGPSTAPDSRASSWRLGSRLLGQVARAFVPALALAVIAGGTVGAVTLVNLASDDATTDEVADSEAATGASEDTDDSADTPSDLGTPAQAGTEGDPETDELAGAQPGGPSPLTFEQAVKEYGRPDYSAILTRRYPGAQWSLNANDPVDGLFWDEDANGPRPTKAELDALWASVGAELADERSALKKAEADAAMAREALLEARRNDPDLNALLDSFDPRTIWGRPDYAHILTRRYPGAQWSLNANDPAGGLTWDTDVNGPRPTKAQLDALWAEVAREMALEMDPKELARWAGAGDQIYVEGVLRPKGWVGGKNDPQPKGSVNAQIEYRYLPHIANSNGGSPVGTIDIFKDPTGAQNFEQKYGLDLTDLAAMIAAAHGYFGGSHGLGLGLNSDRELMWYSDQVDPKIVEQVLAGIGAVDTAPAPAPEPEPEPEPDGAPADEEAGQAGAEVEVEVDPTEAPGEQGDGSEG